MSLIADTLLAYLPPKRKHTPSGWISFNAPCCVHNGNNIDKRQRGGFIVNAGDAVSYHCFNCGFKASWQPGRTISPKLKNLMRWFGIPDDLITKMTFDALRLKEDAVPRRQIEGAQSSDQISLSEPVPNDLKINR